MVAFKIHLNVLRNHLAPCGNLIHVIPESFNAKVDVVSKLLLPPFTGLWIGKVRKMTPPGPYLTCIRCAIRIFYEDVTLNAIFIHFISFFYFYPWVAHYNNVKAHTAKFF